MSDHEATGNKVAIPDYEPEVGGVGSVSTVEMDDEDKRRAEERDRDKPPTGFAPGAE